MKHTAIKRGMVAAFAAAALVLTGCAAGDTPAAGGAESAAPAEKPIEITFGYIADFNGASVHAIAAELGLWEKYGLKAETPVFTNGPLQIQALGTGDLDFGYVGPGAMWLPASGQAQVISVNATGNGDRVIAQPGIESIKDLKGKTVAVPEGTSGDMILNLALESAGMTIADVEKVVMDPATAVAAFASGQVDAAGLWYPLISTIETQVPDLEILASNEDFKDTVAFASGFVGANDFVAENPEATTKVLQVVREALDYRKANLDEVIELTAKMMKLDPEVVKTDAGNVTYFDSAELDALIEDGTVHSWLTGMNNYFVGAGKVTDPADPATYFTSELFLAAGTK
ncbi:aliphatic sulfonate ABC transporter substrate-binding protein [Microterricola pindariensis]|uniref:Bicyclomycin resistance protein n=1 Tax=Microterricola pindariensis TaxID=478010 RepID=A0ABX5AXN7_9MICO|nr:aliphatic sulfonate ABC transporter substrate-binding protein [Microterricola pindariensis]PPL19662.1 bicyclomycin resistance protein [Microterricola pindariensis]